MANITLRPDLRTNGGEVNDILLQGRYVGTLTLVYREGHRMSGSIQLDKEVLPHSKKQQIVDFVQNYIEQLVEAIQVGECDVTVTYSPYDHIIATENNVGIIQQFVDDDQDEIPDRIGYDYEDELSLEDPMDREILELHRKDRNQKKRGNMKTAISDLDDTADAAYFELVIVGESRNRVEYHIYDRDQDWIAEALVTIDGVHVTGEVNWNLEPLDDEVEAITDLIVSDFNENEIDTFVLDMKHDGNIFETIELTHEAILDNLNEIAEDNETADEEYAVMLIRDDGDTLTYEIYQASLGAIPIGTATIDISQRQLTGFIDFREPGHSDDREHIATLLMEELDKEKEYDSINLTMLYQNEPIDEIVFETERIH